VAAAICVILAFILITAFLSIRQQLVSLVTGAQRLVLLPHADLVTSAISHVTLVDTRLLVVRQQVLRGTDALVCAVLVNAVV
jgi:hypothetical protein